METVTVRPSSSVTFCNMPSRYEPDIGHALEGFLRFTVELTEANCGILWLYDQTGTAVRTITCFGMDRDGPELFDTLSADCPVSDSARQSKQQVIVEDISTSRRFRQFAPLYATHAIAAVQANPLYSRQARMIGLISTYFARPHRPSGRHLRLLELCYAESLKGIDSEQTEQAIRIVNEELMRRNADLEDRNTKLARSNQELERFALTATRHLQEPLRAIVTNAELLATKWSKTSDRAATVFLGDIDQSAQCMSRLRRDLSDYSKVRLPMEAESATALNLNAVVRKVIHNLKPLSEESGASITSDALPTIPAAENGLVGPIRSQAVPILIIEGNPGDVDLFKFALNGAQIEYQLSVIDNGVEALAFARQEGQYANTNVPDLIVLDLHLPKRDGVEVLDAMIANPAFSHVPVMVLSSGLSHKESVALRRLHDSTYITKPFGLAGLRKVGESVKELLLGGTGTFGKSPELPRAGGTLGPLARNVDRPYSTRVLPCCSQPARAENSLATHQ
jgi:two-component system, chemotaxis family, response regulator Rcp1